MLMIAPYGELKKIIPELLNTHLICSSDIGMHPEHPDTPVGGYSYSSDIGTAAVDEKPVVILLEDSSSSSSDDENEKSPLISTAAQPLSDVNIPTSKAHRVSIDKVRFQLGWYSPVTFKN